MFATPRPILPGEPDKEPVEAVKDTFFPKSLLRFYFLFFGDPDPLVLNIFSRFNNDSEQIKKCSLIFKLKLDKPYRD